MDSNTITMPASAGRAASRGIRAINGSTGVQILGNTVNGSGAVNAYGVYAVGLGGTGSASDEQHPEPLQAGCGWSCDQRQYAQPLTSGTIPRLCSPEGTRANSDGAECVHSAPSLLVQPVHLYSITNKNSQASRGRCFWSCELRGNPTGLYWANLRR